MTRFLLLRAWFFYWTRRHGEAEAVLDRGVTLAPASFRLRVLRGKVYLAQHRRKKALQELRICYRLDPARFTRQPFDGRLQEEVVLEAQIPPEPELFDLCFREDGPFLGEWDDLMSAQEEMGEEMIAGTDFHSVAEYRRLRALPPITPAEIEGVDLDGLLDQLSSLPTQGETLDQG